MFETILTGANELVEFVTLLLQGEIVWRAPVWLWALPLPLVWWVFKQLGRKQQQQGYADDHLWAWVATDPPSKKGASLSVESDADSAMTEKISHSTRPGRLRSVIVRGFSWLSSVGSFWTSPSRLITLAWVCLILAVAGPRSLISAPEVQSREGVDILVSMDLSHSMQAKDLYPNRFLFAKSLVESLTHQLEIGDRLALQAFAGQAHMVSPLSYDRALFRHSLNLLEPGLLPMKGSWLELAIIGGLTHLSQTAGEAKVMLVLTNGAPEFFQEVPLPSGAQSSKFSTLQALSETGVKIILVGVGEPVATTLPDSEDRSGKLHVNGLLVQSRLEEGALKKMAQKLEGVYLRADGSQAFMARLLKEMTLPAASRTQTHENSVWREYAQPFVWLGLGLLLLAFYGLGLFKTFLKQVFKRRARSKNNSKIHSSIWLSGALALVMLQSYPQPGLAQPGEDSKFTTVMEKSVHKIEVKNVKNAAKEAYQAYQAGDYERSRNLYDLRADFSGWFGAGAAAYQLNEFESAVAYYNQAAWTAVSDESRAKALFNLGNSYAQLNLWALAVEAYQQALQYQHPYTKAENNLEIALHQKAVDEAAERQTTDEESEGGGQRRDNSDAFYGGQKPNSTNREEPGFGSDEELVQGNEGEKVQVPQSGDETDYRLSRGDVGLTMNATGRANQRATRLLNQQQQRRRAEQFEHALQGLEDDQKTLLKRMFEREAGFHAPQSEAHSIPGIQPW